MPVEIKGLDETLRAMRQFEPDLAKNLNTEIRAFLTPIQRKAQGYAVADLPGLSNWKLETKGRKITEKSSVFAIKAGSFPKYNANLVRRGIKIFIGETKPNRMGFVSFYRLSNLTAAGAIMETAGRKNGAGQPWDPKSSSHNDSHSRNPKAGLHFNNSLGAMRGNEKMRGRLIFRAWNESEGVVLGRVVKSVERTIEGFHRRASAQVLKNVA